MREYELTVVYDLAVAEAGGPDAAPQRLSQLVEARGGKVLKVDHWGRRRLAYPINHALDADYVVSRVELEPEGVNPLEAALRIDERVYRHLIVRADELPAPMPPREPRQAPAAATAAPAAPATATAAPATATAAPAAATAAPAAATAAPAAPAPAGSAPGGEAPAPEEAAASPDAGAPAEESGE